MAAGRSLKSLVSRRRRADDEGEDDEGSDAAGDSQSEGSVLTDVGEGEDASSVAATERSDAGLGGMMEETAANGNSGAPGSAGSKTGHGKRKGAKEADDSQESQQSEEKSMTQVSFKPAADTEAMMNGLRIDDGAQGTVDFESLNPNAGPSTAVPTNSTATNGDSARAVSQRQRQDHQEYRRRRDTDPTFVPNRGSFYMHNTRANADARGDEPSAGVGRGRGRGGLAFGGGFQQNCQMAQQDKTAEQPWRHDLHETINEEPPQAQRQQAKHSEEDAYSARLFGKTHPQTAPQGVSLSSTVLVAKAQVRVAFPGVKEPIVHSNVPIKRYVRLPEHRAPLRRDKPVRVSLPERPARYIFPTPERSFIFIPRQNRAGQQNVGRGQFPRHAGSYGYNSRRNSVFGGSVYSGSVAPSRRSSLAREVSRESAFSPTGSHYSGFIPPSKPIVLMPESGPYYAANASPTIPLSCHQTPNAVPQVFTYPLPQEAHFQGTPATAVHQPRPQKTISVSGIESPAVLQQASQDQQPFANQLPAHMDERQTYAAQPGAFYSPRQQLQYPYQQHGTPLSGIPEASIQAPVFSPSMHTIDYVQPYYSNYQQPQPYYYPQFAPSQNRYGQMPFYSTQQQHQPYPMAPYNQQQHPYPMMSPNQQQPQIPEQPPIEAPNFRSQTPQHEAQPSQSGMVARESNGMVYYLSADQAQQRDHGAVAYQPAEGFVPSDVAYAAQTPQTGGLDQNMGIYYGDAQPGMDVGVDMGIGMGMGQGVQQEGMWYPPYQQQQQQQVMGQQ